ncbi:hypothetical protein H4R18_004680 [Coemansia javaensis]|uniref:Enoyl reductase (ER) domain-containing protein n=1 Tax=Coemansia javaensis TaxID=2761396 RepID=A0A9W8H5I0_9FUNG|nr:hypothetical protein H4R18_004680 [Coemansia javaensis]
MVEGKFSEIRGWAAFEPGIKVKPWSYRPRPLGDNDVEIKIEYSGICGSDLHTIKGEWGPPQLPAIVGHEIVGRVVAKGDGVAGLAEGDLVGVGAQVYACLKDSCETCSRGLDPHCPDMVFTYNDNYADGKQAQGGYSEAVRVDANYTFKIPAAIDPVHAPPLMCAGVTVFCPMLKHDIKQGDRVGIVGIGGLGHLAIQFASALGAHVTAFSHSPNKREECMALGATAFVDTSDEKQVEGARQSLTHLFVASNAPANQYNEFIKWMKIGGAIVMLAVPPGKMSFSASEFTGSEVSLSGSLVGGVKTLRKTLDFAAEHGIKPIIERFPMDQVNEALARVDSGRIRYRAVLENPRD